jgi:hypothetical protein
MRISGFSISLLLIACTFPAFSQDSIKVPLSIRGGIDIYGPIYNYYHPENRNIEGYLSFDPDLKKTYVLETGYQDFTYSQNNYKFSSNGVFLRLGADFNIIKPFQTEGKYFAGVGLRYGMSLYNTQVPSFSHDNYWGTAASSISTSSHLAHFIEADPGIRTQVMKYVSIGFYVKLRIMIYRGGSKDLKPVNIPGFGNGTKTFSPGINYYISFSIPYKSIYTKPEVEKVPEVDQEPDKK